jgi:hypothetical protein
MTVWSCADFAFADGVCIWAYFPVCWEGKSQLLYPGRLLAFRTLSVLRTRMVYLFRWTWYLGLLPRTCEILR